MMQTWTGLIRKAPTRPMYRWTGPAPVVDPCPNHVTKPRDHRPRTVLAGVVSGLLAAGGAAAYLVPLAYQMRGYRAVGGEWGLIVAVGIVAGIVGTYLIERRETQNDKARRTPVKSNF